MNVVGYIRVSTQGQVKDGYSLKYQEEEIQAYCEKHGWNLIHIFRDEGINGAKINEEALEVDRVGLQEMLAHLSSVQVGMNQFIFEGYFDNILESFGWQHIHIGVPFRYNLIDDICETKYVMETTGSIREASSLKDTSFDANHMEKENMIGDLIVYNPDKWAYSHFRFFRNKPSIHQKSQSTIYQVLHISQKAN